MFCYSEVKKREDYCCRDDCSCYEILTGRLITTPRTKCRKKRVSSHIFACVMHVLKTKTSYLLRQLKNYVKPERASFRSLRYFFFY